MFRTATGAELGIATVQTLDPGVGKQWFGLGELSLLLMIVAWGGWPADTAATPAQATPRHRPRQGALRALFIEYGLNAAGWVPHMMFLVDFVALGLGRAWLIVSSIVVGAFVTGTPPLVLGRIHELLPHHPAQQKAAWSTATVAFALFQAAAAYGHSFVFAHSGGDYRLLFAIGTGAMALALAIDLMTAVVVARIPDAQEDAAKTGHPAASSSDL